MKIHSNASKDCQCCWKCEPEVLTLKICEIRTFQSKVSSTTKQSTVHLLSCAVARALSDRAQVTAGSRLSLDQTVEGTVCFPTTLWDGLAALRVTCPAGGAARVRVTPLQLYLRPPNPCA